MGMHPKVANERGVWLRRRWQSGRWKEASKDARTPHGFFAYDMRPTANLRVGSAPKV